MTGRAAADRYARALLDVVVREADPQRAAHDLTGFQQLMAEHAQLQQTLTNPALPIARKRAIVEELATRLQLTPVVTKLLLLLVDRDRLILLDDIVGAYRARLMDHLQVVEAEVTSTVPLADEQAKALENSLGRVTGRRVSLVSRVDPALVGGLVARVGSTVYDGSVKRRLELMKARMSEAV
ncbi:MAG: ATP synthase F1 subunit delta [Acidobacteria bacterium]|nr:ATP synthase F1 subunit delta [Acidobacteriota bacterium]